MAIKFYFSKDAYAEFSNFALHPIVLKEKVWKTNEHYYQAMKFEGTSYEDAVRLSVKPYDARKIGNDRSLPLRKDWEQIKDDIMLEAVRAKFTQHELLRKLLIDTGDEEIIEDSPSDTYWGCGRDGTGRNMLGVILMKVRKELVESQDEEGDSTNSEGCVYTGFPCGEA